MKKSIFIFGSIIAIAILFYPQQSISLSTGSPGGKAGSPTDGVDCMQCHGVLSTSASTANITSNIPPSGYVPGNIYNITAVHNGAGFGDPTGFEITCEENTSNTKTGIFFITNSNTTQLVNNGNAVTHTAAGNSFMTWSFDWEAPLSGTGNVTFYGAFIEAGYPIGLNQGDYFSSTTLSASEFIPLLGCTDTVACNYNASANIDDGSCIYVNTSVSTSNVSCFGLNDGSVVATANGGVSPYQYSLVGGLPQASGTFSNLTAGTYTVTVTDIQGCSYTDTIVILQPAYPVISVEADLLYYGPYDVRCFGESNAAAIVTGSGVYFEWFDALGNIVSTNQNTSTILSAGTYTVTSYDANGCSLGSSIQITEPSLLISTSINATDETAALNDGSITANTNGGVPPYQYSIDGVNFQSTNFFTGLAPGPYNIVSQDANGCTASETTFVNAYIATGIDNIKNSSKKLLKITDVLGRETKEINQILYYIYDDGIVEKRIIIE
jgi:hypothetical protein